MVTVLEALVLGVIQGLTEWLPVSSSGHLVLAQEFFSLSADLSFDIMLHIATLIAVLIFLREDVKAIARAFYRGKFKSPDGKLGLFAILSLIPSGIIVFLMKDYVDAFFQSTLVVGLGLVFTGCLLAISNVKKKGESVGLKDSIIIGAAEGIAVIPGVSRSGSTISAGLLSGVDRKKAFRFSFLISIPAVLAASIYKGREAILMIEPLPLVVGMVTAFIIGYLTLEFLTKIAASRKFHWFALYCWVLGIIVILLSI